MLVSNYSLCPYESAPKIFGGNLAERWIGLENKTKKQVDDEMIG